MKPSRETEHLAIAEFLHLLKATTEVVGRSYNRKDVWDTLSKTTVVIKKRNEREVRQLLMKEGDFDIDGFAEAMYENILGEDDNMNDSDNNNSDGGTNGSGCCAVNNVELPPEFYGIDPDNNEDIDSQNVDEVRTSNDADARDVVVKVGRSGEVKIRRAKVNLMAFKDVIAEGKTKLEAKNLPVVRYRGILRDGRKRKFAEYIYDSVTTTETNATDNGSFPITNEMSKLKRMKWNNED